MPNKKTPVKQKTDEVKKAIKQKAASVKKSVKQKTQKRAASAVKQDRLELLFTIVNRNKAEYYIDLLHSFEVNVQLVALGQGTASADILNLFGLTDSDKAIILSVIKDSQIADALSTLEEKFKTIKNGNGIAYTVPFSGVIGTLIYGFLSNNKKAVKDDKTDRENSK